MFQPGDLIAYGRTGVCRVERIEKERGQRYYVLSPLYQNCSILTPVEGKVFMRPILTREEADALIDLIPSMEVQPVESRAIRELTDRYQASIATHDVKDLVELTMSIYAKRQKAARDRKKFGAVDERFLKEGETLLFGELAASLDIPLEEVQGYIRTRLEGGL